MKVKKEMNKKLKISLIVLVIIVLLVVGYFGVKAYKTLRAEKNEMIFEQGFTYGYTSAVMQIMNISETCQPFPVYLGNQTKNLISIDCLNFQQA